MILDTSVVIKWFYEEAETEHALRFFDRVAQHRAHVIIPDLLFYEFANTLKTKGKVGRPDIEEALRTLHELPWTIVEPNPHFMSHALQVAEQYSISVYDASFVSLAFEWDVPLITADERLVRTVGAPRVKLLRETNE